MKINGEACVSFRTNIAGEIIAREIDTSGGIYYEVEYRPCGMFEARGVKGRVMIAPTKKMISSVSDGLKTTAICEFNENKR